MKITKKSMLLGGLLMTPLAQAEPWVQWQTSQLPSKNSLRGSGVAEQTLWVSGSKNGVFRSTDQGNSWVDVSVKAALESDFRDIEVFDPQHAVVMGVGTGETSILYETKDAGQSWQVLFANPDPSGFFDSMGFWDQQHGLLLGDPVDGYYVIYKTEDGGKHWRRIGKDKLPPMLENESAFAASGNTLIVGDDGKAWFTTGGKSASVYSSVDHGESWQRVAVPLHQKTATSGGYALALNSRKQLFVLGGDYQQRSQEYVNIATLVLDKWLIPANENKGLRTAMSCIDAVCINTGMQYTGISYDHGANWQVLWHSGYYTMAAGGGLFVAAGPDGKIGVATAAQILANLAKRPKRGERDPAL